jgi:hypothetical protein
LVGALAVAGAVIAVVVFSSGSSGSTGHRATPVEMVRQAAETFATTSGSATCDLFAPAFIASNYNGSIDACRKDLSTATSFAIAGPQTISVQGARATDGFNNSNNQHYSLVFVNQNGRWLVEHSLNDTTDAQTAADDYIKAKGSAVCNLVTDRFKTASFGGANCPTTESGYAPATPTGDQVQATSTQATDDLVGGGGTRIRLTLAKVGDVWLVDSDSTAH